jgi:hypothetical protein
VRRRSPRAVARTEAISTRPVKGQPTAGLSHESATAATIAVAALAVYAALDRAAAKGSGRDLDGDVGGGAGGGVGSATGGGIGLFLSVAGVGRTRRF